MTPVNAAMNSATGSESTPMRRICTKTQTTPRRDIRHGARRVGHEMTPATGILDEVDGLAADTLDHGG